MGRAGGRRGGALELPWAVASDRPSRGPGGAAAAVEGPTRSAWAPAGAEGGLSAAGPGARRDDRHRPGRAGLLRAAGRPRARGRGRAGSRRPGAARAGARHVRGRRPAARRAGRRGRPAAHDAVDAAHRAAARRHRRHGADALTRIGALRPDAGGLLEGLGERRAGRRVVVLLTGCAALGAAAATEQAEALAPPVQVHVLALDAGCGSTAAELAASAGGVARTDLDAGRLLAGVDAVSREVNGTLPAAVDADPAGEPVEVQADGAGTTAQGVLELPGGRPPAPSDGTGEAGGSAVRPARPGRPRGRQPGRAGRGRGRGRPAGPAAGRLSLVRTGRAAATRSRSLPRRTTDRPYPRQRCRARPRRSAGPLPARTRCPRRPRPWRCPPARTVRTSPARCGGARLLVAALPRGPCSRAARRRRARPRPCRP